MAKRMHIAREITSMTFECNETPHFARTRNFLAANSSHTRTCTLARPLAELSTLAVLPSMQQLKFQFHTHAHMSLLPLKIKWKIVAIYYGASSAWRGQNCFHHAKAHQTITPSPSYFNCVRRTRKKVCAMAGIVSDGSLPVCIHQR